MRGIPRPLSVALLTLVLWALPPGAMASPPSVVIIIDDLGNNYHNTLRTVSLPGTITCAFLPHSDVSRTLAKRARRNGKEVMLHLPMQAVTEESLGAGGLTLDMSETEFKASIASSLRSVPHARGLNNHMGSLLTRHPGHMRWLMETVSAAGESFYFVDSKTTGKTIAHRIAREHDVPYLIRDVFLDSTPGERAYVHSELDRLVKLAKRNGVAVGIGHPYHETLAVLEERLPALAANGVRLVTVSEMLAAQRRTSWSGSVSLP